MVFSISGMKDKSIYPGKVLGKGTYGKVYTVGENRALKVIKSDEDGYREIAELNNLMIFDHPNIIKIIDFAFLEDAKGKYLGLLLPLAKYDMEIACRMQQNMIHLDRWIYEIVSAVYFLHKNGFYHCDMKIANVLVLQDDRSVVADLGFMRKSTVPSLDFCQTYQSPQLSYRLNKKSDLKKKVIKCDRHLTDLCSEQSSPFQDDIWALGITLYQMITNLYKIKQNIEWTNEDHVLLYCFSYTYRINVFKDMGIEYKYINILNKLLCPYASRRSLNLLELLDTPCVLSDKTDYIHGKLNNQIENKNPITAVDDKFNSFLHKLIWNISHGRTMLVNDFHDHMSFLPYIYIQCIDLYFRCYTLIQDYLDEEAYIVLHAIYSLVLKTTKLDYFYRSKISPYEYEQLCMYERQIVDHLDGLVIRDNVADYLSESERFKFVKWILANTNRYEQLSTTNMVRLSQEL